MIQSVIQSVMARSGKEIRRIGHQRLLVQISRGRQLTFGFLGFEYQLCGKPCCGGPVAALWLFDRLIRRRNNDRCHAGVGSTAVVRASMEGRRANHQNTEASMRSCSVSSRDEADCDRAVMLGSTHPDTFHGRPLALLEADRTTRVA